MARMANKVQEIKEVAGEDTPEEKEEKKADVRAGINIDLVDIIHPLKYMIDIGKNLV